MWEEVCAQLQLPREGRVPLCQLSGRDRLEDSFAESASEETQALRAVFANVFKGKDGSSATHLLMEQGGGGDQASSVYGAECGCDTTFPHPFWESVETLHDCMLAALSLPPGSWHSR